MGRLIDETEVLRDIDAIRPVDPKKSDYTHGIDVGLAMAKVAIKEQPSTQQWIPCSEKRFPKIGEMVLITNGKGHVSYGKFRGVDFWLDNVRCYWWWKGNRAEWVLAWKPLEEPWKGEEE